MTSDHVASKEQFMANHADAHGQHVDDHGHSIAGWTGMIVITLGAVFIGFGVGLGHEWAWILGWIIVAVGAVASWGLARAGFGHTKLPKPMDHDEWVAAQNYK